MRTFLSKIIDTVRSVISQVGKVRVSDIFMTIFLAVPEIVDDLRKLKGAGKKDKIMAALTEFDRLTGSDAKALDIIKDMPPEVEERLWDHLKGFIEILSLYGIGDPEYRTRLEKKEEGVLDENGIALINRVVSRIFDKQKAGVLLSSMPKVEAKSSDTYLALVSSLEAMTQNPGGSTTIDQVKLNRAAILFLLKSFAAELG